MNDRAMHDKAGERADVVFCGSWDMLSQQQRAYLSTVARASLGWGFHWGKEFSAAFYLQTKRPELLPAGVAMYNRGAIRGDDLAEILKSSTIALVFSRGTADDTKQLILQAGAAGVSVLAECGFALDGHTLPQDGFETFCTVEELIDKIFFRMGRQSEHKAVAGEGHHPYPPSQSIHRSVHDPEITVAIFTYNRARYLGEAIRSALAQHHHPLEILVVDDGSTDDTPAVVKRFQSENIHYIRKTANEGRPKARNLCIREAKGEFIAWLGDDDTLEPDTLAEYVRVLSEHRDVDVIYGDIQSFDSNTGKDLRLFSARDYTGSNRDILSNIVKGSGITDGGSLIRKSLYEQYGYYDEEYLRAQDNEFWTRIATTARFHKVNKVVYRYREHAESASHAGWIDRSYESKTIRNIAAHHTLNEVFPALNWSHPEDAKRQSFITIAKGLAAFGDFYNAIRYFRRVSLDLLPPDEIRLLFSASLVVGDADEVRHFLKQYRTMENCSAQEVLRFETIAEEYFVHVKKMAASREGDALRSLAQNIESRFGHTFDAAYAIGRYFESEGDRKSALNYFRDAVRLNPSSKPAFAKALEVERMVEGTETVAGFRNRLLEDIPVKESPSLPSTVQSVRADMIPPLISVVVPTYNRPELLKQAISSVLSQSFQHFEIIVVNDAGTSAQDGVKSFQDKRITYLEHPQNKGLAGARNTGIRAAKGKYVALLDDDDVFYPHHLQTAIQHLSDACPVVYTDAVRATYARNGGSYQLVEKRSPYCSIDYDRNKLLVANIAPVNCFVFGSELARSAGLFNETFGVLEDWEFWLRLSQLSSFRHIPEITVQFNHRIDDSSIVRSADAFQKCRDRVHQTYREEIQRIPNVQEIVAEFNAIWTKDGDVQRQARQAASAPTEGSPVSGKFAGKRVAIIYDNSARPDTTGEYCKRALSAICQTTHYLPTQLQEIPAGFDLYLNIDDSFHYVLPGTLRPSAWWVIDTHLQYEWDLQKARTFDLVFAAQRDGAQRLVADGVANATWLPLACDPEIHSKCETPKTYNVSFVGNIFPGPREELLKKISANIQKVFVGKKFFREMAEVFSASRIVFNRSIQNDVNMRVFEALSSGSFLLTNNLDDNGLSALLTDGKHLVTYRDEKEMIRKIRYYLKHAKERERIAAAGMAEVSEKHTYRHRMQSILEAAFGERQIVTQAPGVVRRQGAPACEPVSLVILTHNELVYTQHCVASIQQYTRCAYEIYFVDNASTDGTAEWLSALARKHRNYHVILNKENRGFPAGVNQALNIATGKYVLLMNNDVVVTEGWLERMVEVAESDRSIGLVGPVSNSVSGVQIDREAVYADLPSMHTHARSVREKQRGQTFRFPRVAFLCTLIKREVIEKLGGLDERFSPGNFEDDDFCLRAQRAGFATAIARDVFIHHFGSKSFTAGGRETYLSRLEANRKIFVDKWGADPEDIWLRGKSIRRREMRYPIHKDEFIQAFERGMLHIEENEYGPALESLKKAKEAFHISSRNDYPVKYADVLNLMGNVLLSLGDPNAARANFEEELRLHPESSRACVGLGECYFAAQRYDVSKTMFEWGARNDPANQGAVKGLAKVNQQLGLPEHHTTLTEEEVAATPESLEATLALVSTAFERKQFREVLTLIQKAEHTLPEELSGSAREDLMCDLENLKGYSHLGLNDVDAARVCFERALNLKRSSVQACTGLGEALFSLGRLDEAKVMYERGIKGDAGNELAIAGLQKVDQKLCTSDAQRRPQPRRTPDDSVGLESLLSDAYRLFEDKRYKEALGTIAEVELALDQDLPEEEKILIRAGLENLKGFNYLGLNNLTNARLCFEKGLNADPGSSEACAGLGEIFYLSEMDTDAKTMYEWGVMNNPGNPFAVAGLAKVNKALGLPVPHNSLQPAPASGSPPSVAVSRTE